MKYVITIIQLFIAVQFCFSQQKSSKALNDSVAKKYLINGAYKFSYKSPQWQKYLDSALAITPDNAALWQQKAMPYFKKQQCEVGMPFLDKAVSLAPKEYLDYRAFIKCIFSRQYKDAIIDFNKAQQLNGSSYVMDHQYDFYIALCNLQLSNLDTAKILFQKCIDEEKQKNGIEWVHFMNYFYLGIVLYEQQDFKGALVNFDSCLAKYTNFSDAKYYKAICTKKINPNAETKSIIAEALADIKTGYTFTEDNAIYEQYPYQIREVWLKIWLDNWDK